MLALDKHSSLLQTFLNYVRKKFYNIRTMRRHYFWLYIAVKYLIFFFLVFSIFFVLYYIFLGRPEVHVLKPFFSFSLKLHLHWRHFVLEMFAISCCDYSTPCSPWPPWQRDTNRNDPICVASPKVAKAIRGGIITAWNRWYFCIKLCQCKWTFVKRLNEIKHLFLPVACTIKGLWS
jgi:hypothetical protein